MGLALLPLVAAILSISIKADIKGPRPARVLFCGVAVAVPVNRQLKTQGMSVPTSLRYLYFCALRFATQTTPSVLRWRSPTHTALTQKLF